MTNESVRDAIIMVTEKAMSRGRIGVDDAKALLSLCHEVARLRERNAQLEARQAIVQRCIEDVSSKIESLLPESVIDAKLNHTLDDVLYDLKVKYKICD